MLTLRSAYRRPSSRNASCSSWVSGMRAARLYWASVAMDTGAGSVASNEPGSACGRDGYGRRHGKHPNTQSVEPWQTSTNSSAPDKSAVPSTSANPWNSSMDSVELWRWVSKGHRRIDHRNHQPLDNHYFQVYRRDNDYILDNADRIHPPGTEGA